MGRKQTRRRLGSYNRQRRRYQVKSSARHAACHLPVGEHRQIDNIRAKSSTTINVVTAIKKIQIQTPNLTRKGQKGFPQSFELSATVPESELRESEFRE